MKIILIILSILALSRNLQSKTVVIASNYWTSQIVLSQILHQVFSENGIKSELKKIESLKQWRSIMNGRVHVQIEVWQGTMEKHFNKAVKSGKAVSAGTHPAKTREDWWYPSYVESVCPGLPNWKALKKCAPKFSRGNGVKGVYLGGPWEKPDKARIRALGLNFDIVRVKKSDDLWIELAKSFEKKEPIVLFNWTPNWIEAKYKGKFVEFPTWHKDCEEKASWGYSKKWKYDCGNPKSGWLKKLVWSGLGEFHPCAYKIVENFSLTNKMIAEAANFVDGEKMKIKKAANRWIQKYRKNIDSWVPQECKK